MISKFDIEAFKELNDAAFHIQFESKTGSSNFYRTYFKDETLLRKIREVYLDEVLLTEIVSDDEKIIHLILILQKLTDLSENIDQLDIEKILLICHFKAKIHYQLGATWLQLAKEKDPLLSERAIMAFRKAKFAYLPFQNRLEQNDFEHFIRIGCHLHLQFKELDAYSPLARLIAIEFDLLTCANYSSAIEGSAEGLSYLEYLFTLENDKDGAESHQAIQDVMKSYREFTGLNSNSKKNKRETQAVPSSIKRKKKTDSDLQPSSWELKIHSVEQLPGLFNEHHGIPSFLRPRQVQDMQAIHCALHAYRQPLLVTKPTGTGKTAEFVSLANHAFNNGLATIIVVPTTTLASQTKQKFLEYKRSCDEMSFENNDIAIFCPTLGLHQIAPITIVTQASYVAQVKKSLKLLSSASALSDHIAQTGSIFTKEVFFHPDFYSLLIIDEGHHIEGERLYEIISREGCMRPKVLFSASTLPGEYPKIDHLCQRVVTQTIQEAIRAGELSPLQMMNIDFSMYPEAEALTTSITRRLRESEVVNIEEEVGKLLHSKIGFSYTAIGILKQIFERVPSTKKVMIFTDSIDHADVLANMISVFFRQPTRAYHTKTPDREAVIEHFKSTPRSMIVAVGALDEGFDDPDVNLILDFSTYRERIRRMMQRIGRAERVRADGSSAIIISVKILAENLQKMPRDVILPDSSVGYLGLPSDQVLKNGMVDLNLPPSIHISHTIGAETRHLNVEAQGAKIVFPFSSDAFNIGEPPAPLVLKKHSMFQPSSSVSAVESLSIPSASQMDLDYTLDNFDFDLLFTLCSSPL